MMATPKVVLAYPPREEEKRSGDDNDDNDSSSRRRYHLLVLDKDGTLGDCNASLRRWVEHMVTKIRESSSSSKHDNGDETIASSFYKVIGWDPVANAVLPSGIVAAGTWEQILQATHEFLVKQVGHHTIADAAAGEVMSFSTVQGWHQELLDLHGQDPPVITNLPSILLQCEALGYELAVCTSDDRASTNEALQRWQIDSLTQYSICGNEVSDGKPSAAPLLQLCRQASISPQQCIVVGDTTADMGMAVAAQAGLCVGVLTGSGTEEQLLASGAHVILPHVGHLPTLLEEIEASREEDDYNNFPFLPGRFAW
jgi:phosphoglycolate phosphatase